MKKINYPNGSPLWDGQTLYYSNGKYAWHQNMGYYPSGQVATAGLKGFWKNGKIAWDGQKGFDEEGLFMTNFGVALRLNRILVLLVSSKELEVDINGKSRFVIARRD